MSQFKEGDRIAWDGGAGTFLRYEDRDETCRWFPNQRVCIMKMDNDAGNNLEQEDIEEEVQLLVELAITDVAEVHAPGSKVEHAAYGYVIAADGTVYGLTKKWAHGIVCAILFPEVAKARGYAPPAKGAADVFKYQRFELDHQDELPVIRIALGMMAPFNVSKGDKPATQAQIDGLRAVLKCHGKSLSDEINTNYGDVTVRKLLRDMERDDTPGEARVLD